MNAPALPADLPARCAIKVLVDARSHHGGTLTWSLPTLKGDTHTPGEWHSVDGPLRLYRWGLHLTNNPVAWWSEKAVAFWAEHDGASVGPEADGNRDETKFAVQKARLLRPLTRAELEAFGIYQTGEHEVRTGVVHAYGSAQVTAYGSAQVTAYGSAQVTAYDTAQVTAYGSAQVTACGSAQVTAYGSAQVRAYDTAQVRAYDTAQVTACGSAQVRAYDTAQVRAYHVSRVHVAGSAVCSAWQGTTMVLTRDERAVIVDQRGAAAKTYRKKLGLDGWRYRDGKFVQIKVRAKAVAQ